MRRASALLAVPLLGVAALAAGCGSSKPADANSSVSVSGAFGAAPKVTIPSATASPSLYTKTVIGGKGAPLSPTDSFEANYVAYDWSGKTHKLEASSYATHTKSLFSGQLLPGLSSAMKGAKVGSRVLAVIPPKEGFGPQGNSQLGVKPTDTLVFVIDVLQKVGNSATGAHVSNGGGSLPTVSTPAAGQQPTVTVPKSAPPKNLTSTTLIKGAGDKVTSGETLLVQYTGVNWRTGKVFDASYLRHQPLETVLATSSPQGGVIPGWVKGLSGQTVGSRVMLTIPPSDGYGSKGQPQAGIKGTDTMVFVIDILAAIKQ